MEKQLIKKSYTFKYFLMRFRRNLITGIITALPIYITYIFIAWLMRLFHKKLNFVPQKIFPDNVFLTTSLEVILFVFIIMCLFLLGLLTNHYIGKKLIKTGDAFLNKIPLIRNIYMSSKQILSSFAVSGKKAFRKVVMIEYPRKGIQSLAFLTGEIKVSQKGKKDKILASVFLPSTPNPTTGYFLLLPKKDLLTVDISIEEAIRLIISGGILGKHLKIHDK